MTDFLNPERLWWLLAVLAMGIAYVAVQRWRRRATVRFTQVDLLDRVAPSRPGWRRHVVAGIQLLGLAAGVVAIARPISTTTERTESEGRILVLFDVSLSMMATDVDPTRLDAAKAAAREFVDQVDPDIEVGLVSFSGSVATEVQPTLDREALDQGIEDLELAESTAIGDALAHGSDLLTQLAGEADAQNDEGATADDEELAPGAMVLLTDGETTVGRPDGGRRAGGRRRRDPGVHDRLRHARRLDHRSGQRRGRAGPGATGAAAAGRRGHRWRRLRGGDRHRACRRLRRDPRQPRGHARRGDRDRSPS